MHRAIRKRVFRHMRTAKTQISLNRSITIRLQNHWNPLQNEWRENKSPDENMRMRGLNLYLCILRMFGDTYSLGVANVILITVICLIAFLHSFIALCGFLRNQSNLTTCMTPDYHNFNMIINLSCMNNEAAT